MDILKEKMLLANGVSIPSLALGTWQIDNKTVRKAIKDAYELGYRHIDSASAYKNEEGVGKAVKELNVSREDIFITTKVPAEIKTYQGARDVIKESLKKLDLDYIDLLLIHAPKPWEEMGHGKNKYYQENLEVWKALEEFYQLGLVKAIGVSNFEIDDLKNIFAHCKIKPMVNQIPVYIGYTPMKLIDFCKENNVLVEAYSPLGTGRLLKRDLIVEMAHKYGVTSAQLCIRYDYQLGLLPLPKSTHKEFMKINAMLDFEISKEDMDLLKSIDNE